MKNMRTAGETKISVRDNVQQGPVKSISTNSEKYDMGRIQEKPVTGRGYPAEAWNYKY